MLVDVEMELSLRWAGHDSVVDPVTGDRWVRASRIGYLDTDPGHGLSRSRADKASVRRSIRALEARGLLETRMLDAFTSQRDSEVFDVEYEIMRSVLVARLTPAGWKYVEEILEESW